MNAEQLSSRIIDLAAEKQFVDDFSIEVSEGVVVEARLELEEGFVDVFRNFDTGRVAYAYIVDEDRVFGVDNTGSWHRHPVDSPEEHVSSSEVGLEEFLTELEEEFFS